MRLPGKGDHLQFRAAADSACTLASDRLVGTRLIALPRTVVKHICMAMLRRTPYVCVAKVIISYANVGRSMQHRRPDVLYTYLRNWALN